MRRHYRVTGELDGTGRQKQGTVTIDGEYIQVRPYRSTRVYELPASEVKWMVFERLDKTNKPDSGKMQVDKHTFSVMRPYELSLGVVATMICKKVMIMQVIAKKEAKKGKKGKR